MEDVFKLAKEKGYKVYNPHCLSDKKYIWGGAKANYLKKVYAIELYLVKEWLKEKYSIHLQIGMYGINYYTCSIWSFNNKTGNVVRHLKNTMTELFSSEQDALKEGILESLKMFP
jgi:hypothetical protein